VVHLTGEKAKERADKALGSLTFYLNVPAPSLERKVQKTPFGREVLEIWGKKRYKKEKWGVGKM